MIPAHEDATMRVWTVKVHLYEYSLSENNSYFYL